MVEFGFSFLFFIVALLFTLGFGWFLIRYLVKIKMGQSILEIGPNWHKNKEGTPTMGGIMFILSALIITIFICLYFKNMEPAFVLSCALAFGLIGFVDDLAKFRKRKNEGLTPIQKIILQVLASVVFVSTLYYFGIIGAEIFIPFFKITIQMDYIWFLLLMTFLMVGTVNAVNLTDGVDGLASMVTLPVFGFFLAYSFFSGQSEIGYFISCLIGGLVAFLIYNFNPAKVFMGDTGSLFLGGAVCALSYALDLSIVIIIVGIVYMIEALSVILQVAYFKLSKGKRLFLMAPIHHHFEKKGWSEKKVCFVFFTVSVLAAVITYYLGV